MRGLPLAAGALIAVGAARIVATYGTFSQTFDEPAHLVAGIEWLDHRSYWIEPLHPPLARVAAAVGPWLDGVHLSDSFPAGRVEPPRMFREGNALLEAGGGYARNLALARLGTLPFFLLACFAVFPLTARFFGGPAALGAVAFATTSPMLLAHGGLATTDMALAAALTLFVVSLCRYLDAPGPLRALALGGAAGLALLAKLTAVLFLPAAVAAALVLFRASPSRVNAKSEAHPRLFHLALATGMAALAIWAMYRFSIGRPVEADERFVQHVAAILTGHGALRAAAEGLADARIVPAVEWFAGLKDVAAGPGFRKGYLLGSVYEGGNPFFFPVGILVKTPLALLLLELLGVAMAWAAARRVRDFRPIVPAAVAVAILLTTLPTQINIGVRHVLPVFLLLLPYAGYALVRLLSGPPPAWRLAAAGLVLWYAVETTRVHPDYLAYTAEAFRLSREPPLANSDLDWGQDAFRLAATVRALGIDSLHVEYFGSADLRRRGLSGFTKLSARRPVTGWVAISRTSLLLGSTFEPQSDQFAWLQAYRPERKIGRSMLLYRIPPG